MGSHGCSLKGAGNTAGTTRFWLPLAPGMWQCDCPKHLHTHIHSLNTSSPWTLLLHQPDPQLSPTHQALLLSRNSHPTLVQSRYLVCLDLKRRQVAAGGGTGTSFAACQIRVRGRACPICGLFIMKTILEGTFRKNQENNQNRL